MIVILGKLKLRLAVMSKQPLYLLINSHLNMNLLPLKREFLEKNYLKILTLKRLKRKHKKLKRKHKKLKRKHSLIILSKKLLMATQSDLATVKLMR